MVTLKDCKVGSVIVTDRNEIAVIVEIKGQNPSNPIIYQKSVGKRYKGGVNFVKAVIGTVDLALMGAAADVNLDDGGVDDHPFMPEVLKGLKKGAKFNVIGHLAGVTYTGWYPNRPKNCVGYVTDKGAKYVCKLRSVDTGKGVIARPATQFAD